MQDTIVICLLYMMIAIGAATPGEYRIVSYGAADFQIHSPRSVMICTMQPVAQRVTSLRAIPQTPRHDRSPSINGTDAERTAATASPRTDRHTVPQAAAAHNARAAEKPHSTRLYINLLSSQPPRMVRYGMVW